ncbi:MAG: UDP-N-acetylmuramate dehydrogenase [Cyclobacteriaceae bacterium]
MEILENISLKNLNSFSVDVNTRYFARATQVTDILNIIQSTRFKDTKKLILGGGSNILPLNDFDGLTLKIDLRGKFPKIIDTGNLELKIMAGEPWEDLVEYCVANNWGGIENLTLIPGNTGTAPIQNIGAYGREIKDCLKEVEAIETVTGEIITFTNEECQFGYRSSFFKNEGKDRYIIISVTLLLSQKDHQINYDYAPVKEYFLKKKITRPGIKDVMQAIQSIRREKLPDPKITGNAGSFFKNPVISSDHFQALKTEWPDIPWYPAGNQWIKIPAAWLIEQCGWKGYQDNRCGVHYKQPLVLVNFGEASGMEIWQLASRIQQTIVQKFGITMEPEVNLIG